MALAEPPRTDGPTGRCHPDDREPRLFAAKSGGPRYDYSAWAWAEPTVRTTRRVGVAPPSGAGWATPRPRSLRRGRPGAVRPRPRPRSRFFPAAARWGSPRGRERRPACRT